MRTSRAARLAAAAACFVNCQARAACSQYHEAFITEALPRLLPLGGAAVMTVTGKGFECLLGASASVGYNAKLPGGGSAVSDHQMPAHVARVNDSALEIRFDAARWQTPGVSAVSLALVSHTRHAAETAFSVMWVDFGAVDMPPQLHLGCGRDLIPKWFNMDGLFMQEDFFDWGVQADQTGDPAATDGGELGRSLVRWFWDDKLAMFASGSVRAITISHSLMYTLSLARPELVAEFARVLQPGGVVRITEGVEAQLEEVTAHSEANKRSEPSSSAENASEPAFRAPVCPVALAAQMREFGLCPYEVDPYTTFSLAPDSGIRRAGKLELWHSAPRRVFVIEGVKAPCPSSRGLPLMTSALPAFAQLGILATIKQGPPFGATRKVGGLTFSRGLLRKSALVEQALLNNAFQLNNLSRIEQGRAAARQMRVVIGCTVRDASSVIRKSLERVASLCSRIFGVCAGIVIVVRTQFYVLCLPLSVFSR
jgi:hypothetical protein